MYARLVLYTLGPGSRTKAQSLADDLAPAISALTGCASVTFFGDEADGDYGLFVLWDSQKDADAAAEVIAPKLRAGLEGNVQGPPTMRLFEVIK